MSDCTTGTNERLVNNNRADLIAAIRAEHAEIEKLRASREKIEAAEAERKVRAGGRLKELRDNYYRQGWTRFLSSGELGFSKGTAYNYIYAHELYEHGRDEDGRRLFDFPTIGKMRAKEVEVARDLVMGIVPNQKAAPAVPNKQASQQLANLIARMFLPLSPGERQRFDQLQSEFGPTAFYVAMRQANKYRAFPLPDQHERGLGLTRLIIDSGAYSFAQKTSADISEERYFDQYVLFLHENEWLHAHQYVNFDHIDRREPEEAAQISYRYYRLMCDRGLHPMAVYHAREDIGWLHRYLNEEGVEVIGLGARKARNDPERLAFYERAFDVIEKCGRPVRVHGFGIGDERHLLRFPFASCDATSWIEGPQYGIVDYAGPFGGIIHEKGAGSGYAARYYVSARKFARSEQAVRSKWQNSFDLHFVILPEFYDWQLPALAAVGHRKALVSFFHLRQSPEHVDVLHRFIAEPQVVLREEPFAARYKLLREEVHRSALEEARIGTLEARSRQGEDW